MIASFTDNDSQNLFIQANQQGLVKTLTKECEYKIRQFGDDIWAEMIKEKDSTKTQINELHEFIVILGQNIKELKDTINELEEKVQELEYFDTPSED